MKLTFRIWILIIFLILSLLALVGFPPTFLEKGVIVKDVDINSTAFDSGLKKGEIITSVNEQKINNAEDYSKVINSLLQDNKQVKLSIKTKENTYVFFAQPPLEISVADIPKTKIKTGLDLQGGARALIQPEKSLTDKEMSDLIAISTERFNVYGISDVSIRPVKDLSGNNFMLIEIAGATPQELESLVGQQGKFEAKIGNETVFIGGNNDITYVCRDDAKCAGIESCPQTANGYTCQYRFTIHLSETAAKRHADITNKLGINESNPEYLEKQIEFYVDDQFSTSLYISKDLKGQVATQIQVQGSGSGPDQKSAIEDAQNSMKQMQTILITGSLPYKLEIVKLDRISPLLGQKVSSVILLTGLLSMIAVAIIIFARYRNFKSSIALLFTSFSEIIMILGVAAFINWNLDLPSIVGILITIGTGVDQQIVIIDESQSKKEESIKEKIKRALFIVFSAYFTTIVALLPLFRAGAGLLKGFAVTTLIGLTIGVLITRPAFADIIKKISERNAS